MLGVFITDRVQKIETENNAVRVKGKKVSFDLKIELYFASMKKNCSKIKCIVDF